MLDKHRKMLYYLIKMLSTAKIKPIGENVSSEKVEKLQIQFEALSPDDKKDFTAFVKAFAQSQLFNRNDLVAAKADDGIKCPHCNRMEDCEVWQAPGHTILPVQGL
jgi:hypothetical protein